MIEGHADLEFVCNSLIGRKRILFRLEAVFPSRQLLIGTGIAEGIPDLTPGDTNSGLEISEIGGNSIRNPEAFSPIETPAYTALQTTV